MRCRGNWGTLAGYPQLAEERILLLKRSLHQASHQIAAALLKTSQLIRF